MKLKKEYFIKHKQISKNKVYAYNTFISSLIIIFLFLFMFTGTELNKFYEQWNREYVVSNFGIYIYQINDAVRSLEPKITEAFIYDTAMKEFREFYESKEVHENNEYTNIFKGKNIITIHAESLQNFVIDMTMNGEEITPNINSLVENGLYFSNFYSQTSVGTSSDAEFTFNTSLMPSSNGSVFVSYWDREYITIPKLLKENGYYTFSMYGDDADIYNRRVMYNRMGYDKYYSKTDYILKEGNENIYDAEFFLQSVEKILTEIDDGNVPFYATTITLSNITPYNIVSDILDFDTALQTEIDGELVNTPYIKGLKIEKYIKSVHYMDYAIGKYINALDAAGVLEDTVVIVYGDHDAGISKSDFDILYNIDSATGEILSKQDPGYIEMDNYSYEINKKVPFIIYTKDKTIKKVENKVMGMYDVLPTLGNMFGFQNKYSLGHDIFSIDNNIVIFPNGDYINDKVYYDAKNEEYLVITEVPLEEDCIKVNMEYTNKILKVSNNIITYDLIRKDKENEEFLMQK